MIRKFIPLMLIDLIGNVSLSLCGIRSVTERGHVCASSFLSECPTSAVPTYMLSKGCGVGRVRLCGAQLNATPETALTGPAGHVRIECRLMPELRTPSHRLLCPLPT